MNARQGETEITEPNIMAIYYAALELRRRKEEYHAAESTVEWDDLDVPESVAEALELRDQAWEDFVATIQNAHARATFKRTER